jgi:UDP-glucuronate 4-epimerase
VAHILVTGTAGFIGFHVTQRLLAAGFDVLGVDALTDYYDIALKHARLARLTTHARFTFAQLDIARSDAMFELTHNQRFDFVLHLAAQAGVRYAHVNPHAYAKDNGVGFINIAELCRHTRVNHFVFASSSSVYGANTQLPFRETDAVDHPVSLYAATKRSNELVAHAYAHIYGVPSTGLRFFSVYGPWGRPDMAYYMFSKDIVDGRGIKLFNHGLHKRDMTYIDDVVEAIMRILEKPPHASNQSPLPPSHGAGPFQILNIGNGNPVLLADLLALLERGLGRSAIIERIAMQTGEVQDTAANVDALQALTGFIPNTPISVGIERFLAWFRTYYGIN